MRGFRPEHFDVIADLSPGTYETLQMTHYWSVGLTSSTATEPRICRQPARRAMLAELRGYEWPTDRAVDCPPIPALVYYRGDLDLSADFEKLGGNRQRYPSRIPARCQRHLCSRVGRTEFQRHGSEATRRVGPRPVRVGRPRRLQRRPS